MLVSFREVFGDPGPEAALFPDRVMGQLDNHLPEGIRYYDLDGGVMCIGPSGDGDFNISGFAFDLTPEMSSALGSNPSDIDILNYSYNAQRPIKMKLINPGVIIVNGEEMPADQCVISRGHKVSLDDGSFYAHPSPFPGPFDIVVETEDGGYSKCLEVKRVPSESVEVIKFESNSDDSLIVRYSIASENPECADKKPVASFNMAVRPERCASLRDVVVLLEIFRAAFAGKLKIGGQMLDGLVVSNKINVADDLLMHWLNKALAVEEKLGLAFDPKSIAVDSESAAVIEELYIGLIKHCPIKTECDHANINIEKDGANEIETALADGKTSSLALYFLRTRDYELFGEQIAVQAICGVSGFTSGKVECKRAGETKLVLENMPGEAGGFESYYLFEDEQSLERYRNANQAEDVMARLCDAKTIGQYLDEERDGL